MSDERQTMQDRLRRLWAEELGIDADSISGAALELTEGFACRFAESEVRAALAPREPSPQLAEAEAWLRRNVAEFPASSLARARDAVIVDEMDRLRAEVARLSQPAPAHDANWRKLASDLRDAVLSTTPSAEDVATGTAVKVARACAAVRDALEGSAPAQDRATRVVWTVINSGYEKAEAAIQYALDGHAIANMDIAKDTADDCGDDLYRVTITAERAGKDGTGT